MRWALPPGSSEIHLRGYSLKPRTYYQMDATLEPGKMPFTWPLNVVQAVGLQRLEIALVAWTSYDGPTGAECVCAGVDHAGYW